jgi:hypothetical protein
MDRDCIVPNCPRPLYAKGYCNAHYAAARKHPHETPAQLAARTVRIRTPDEMRAVLLARSVEVAGGCRVWQGAKDRRGYGNIRWDDRLWGTHRLAYHLFVEPVRAGIEVCHHCDNPPCLALDHLFPGTHRDNMRDAASKGLMVGNGGRVGELNGMAKLSNADVAAMRASKARGVDLAAQYGVHQVTVSGIRTGRLRRAT